MIPRTKTVIDKRAVMIEVVNATITNRAVKAVFRFDNLIVNTKVVQMQPLLEEFVN